ncbi:MAG TPA: hypothetical protein ENK02_14745 [Planctomycetes bacterium]|nr:hypothetical protein [Planctomycetota bacterium]
MSKTRKVEIFSAGCPLCEETIQLVKSLACPSCEVQILDMNAPEAAARAKDLGIQTIPAVAIDGKLAACCSGGKGPNEADLRAAGLGTAL